MSKEAEKLFQGITNIEDDLLEELESYASLRVPFIDHFFGRLLSMHIRKTALIPAVLLVCLVLIITMNNNGMGNHPITNKGTEPIISTGGYSEGTLVIGKRDGERLSGLDAEELTNISIDDAQFLKLEKAIKKHADYEEITNAFEREKQEILDRLSISTYNVTMIKLNDATVAPVAYEFLFADSEPVGYVEFFLANGELMYNTAFLAEDSYGYFYDFLAQNKNKSFILLNDGYSNYFLGEDNIIYNPSTGNAMNKISVEGDCYQALEGYGISVSYEKIVNEIAGIGE